MLKKKRKQKQKTNHETFASERTDLVKSCSAMYTGIILKATLASTLKCETGSLRQASEKLLSVKKAGHVRLHSDIMQVARQAEAPVSQYADSERTVWKHK